MVGCYGGVSFVPLQHKSFRSIISYRWTEQTSAEITDYVIGPYVFDNPVGLRTHPYSTSNVTNPLKYSDVASLDEVHKIGEVWANMLHNVYAALVKAHGFSSTAQTDPS